MNPMKVGHLGLNTCTNWANKISEIRIRNSPKPNICQNSVHSNQISPNKNKFHRIATVLNKIRYTAATMGINTHQDPNSK